jgi:hypothetical protein
MPSPVSERNSRSLTVLVFIVGQPIKLILSYRVIKEGSPDMAVATEMANGQPLGAPGISKLAQAHIKPESCQPIVLTILHNEPKHRRPERNLSLNFTLRTTVTTTIDFTVQDYDH